MIISVLNPKGGCGKTTLATHIAVALHRRGRKLLLADSDPQGSARDWHAATEDNPLPLVAIDRPSGLRHLPAIARDYDCVIVDGAAKLEDMLVAAIRVSDRILIPVQPSPYDIWAVDDLVQLIHTRREISNEALRATFVVTRAIPRTRLRSELTEALRAHKLDVFVSLNAQRQVYPQTAATGRTVFDTRHKEAIAEMEAITEELIDWGGLGNGA